MQIYYGWHFLAFFEILVALFGTFWPYAWHFLSPTSWQPCTLLTIRGLNLNINCSLFLSFRYGPIHSLYVGPEPVVIVSDYSIMSDLFKRDDAQGRAPFHPYHTLRPGAKERDGTGNASWAPGK